jgi:hypothetical protein
MTHLNRYAELLHAIAADAHANLGDDRRDRQLILEQVLDDIDALSTQMAVDPCINSGDRPDWSERDDNTGTTRWPTNPSS